MQKQERLEYVLKLLLVAVLYVIAAKLGFKMAFTVKQITTVWFPTGLSLVILWLFGNRYWPGIFIGAFLANLLTTEPIWVAGLIAVGNTLEALAGVYLLKRLNFKSSFCRVHDVVVFILAAAGVSTLVSASIGVLSLKAGHLIVNQSVAYAWFIWWVGDMMGNLLFAPVILVWSERAELVQVARRWKEGGLLLALTFAGSIFIFMQGPIGRFNPVAYVIFPFVVWAGLRFRQPGSTLAVLVIALTAVYGTVTGLGPFGNIGSKELDLVMMHSFLLVLSVTALFLAAAVSERADSQKALAEQNSDLEIARRDLEQANRRIRDILSGILEEPDKAAETFEKNKFS